MAKKTFMNQQSIVSLWAVGENYNANFDPLKNDKLQNLLTRSLVIKRDCDWLLRDTRNILKPHNTAQIKSLNKIGFIKNKRYKNRYHSKVPM